MQGDGNGSASDDGLPQEDVEVVIDFYTRKAMGGEAEGEMVATPPTNGVTEINVEATILQYQY